MKLQFWSIGKAHDPYIKPGVDDFTGRINKYFSADWNIIPPPKNAAVLKEPELKKQECKTVLACLQKDDILILLDEKGRQFSSPEVAQMLQQQANESARRVVFLIGGAFGVDEELKKRANITWSLSKLVFPHMLVRLILAEQVYRACTILRNEKYHHM
jgi:23S rRNA (pseudouridine1915-N3)-methyltransferase